MPDLNEVQLKEKRILNYMEKNGYDAAVIGRQDNFAWLTCGGSNAVLITSETGVCMVVITKHEKYVIANTMDGQRIIDEEMDGMGYTLVDLKWYEKSIMEKCLEILDGKRVFSDIPLPGVEFKPGDFYDLHYSLTANELKKYRWLGKKAEEIIVKVSNDVRPGMSEKEIEAMLICEYAKNDILEVVGIIGSDDRIKKYRHCIASEKEVERFLMLAPAIKKWGLTVPVTRMIYFGDSLPEEISRKYDAVCQIEAHTMAHCTPGKTFTNILDIQKSIYKNTGYDEEWRNHFQGGITGYVVNDPSKCTDPNAVIRDCQTFNWYITITGVKVEETMVTSTKGKEILTSTGLWPVRKYEADGEEFELPQILMK